MAAHASMTLLLALAWVAIASCGVAGASAPAFGLARSASGSSGRRLSGARHERRLLAAEKASQCEWDAVTKTCDAADAVNIMYAVRGQPLSAYLWFLLMTHDRQNICDGHGSRSACAADKAHNCVWLDDVLGDDDGGSGSSGSGKRGAAAGASKAAAEVGRAASTGGQLRERWAALQQQVGSSLRDMLGKAELANLHRAMEVQQQQQGGKPAAAAGGGSGSGSSKGAQTKKRAGSGKRRGPNNMCTSHELLENFVFTKTGYSNVLQAPLGLHCPGSKAATLLQCMRQPSSAACAATPGCVAVPRAGSKAPADLCVSSYFKSLSSAQMKKFMYDLTLAEPSAVGSCDGACWMRQAMLCNHTTDASSCSALSFCRPMGAACVPKLYMTDNFGSSVQEYLGECVEVDNKADCEGLKVSMVNKGAYAQWRMPARPSSKCYVPSVGGILGGRVAKEGGPRAELLSVVGGEDERLAASSAAATASADAAQVARIMAERGAGGLRQLYSSMQEALSQ